MTIGRLPLDGSSRHTEADPANYKNKVGHEGGRGGMEVRRNGRRDTVYT